MTCKPTTSTASIRFGAYARKLRHSVHSPHAMGVATLVVVLFILSAGTGMQPDVQSRLFVAGEVATNDIIADRNLHVEDVQATQARREQLASLQPTVFDLSGAETTHLRQRFFEIFNTLNEGEQAPPAAHTSRYERGAAAPLPTPLPSLPRQGGGAANRQDEYERPFAETADPEEEAALHRLFALSGVSFGPEAVRLLSNPRVQIYMTERALPWLEARLHEGVVSDTRMVRSSSGGVLIRNIDNGQEVLRPSGSDVRDISSLLTMFSQQLRLDPNLTLPERRILNQLTAALIMPTLTVNREATQNLGIMAGQNLEPVYYRINRGEVIVHRGERVTREQQLKLQTLLRKGKTFLRAPETIGAFILGLFVSMGLFGSPSAKPSSPMRRRDLFFIAFLLLFFGMAAKGLHVVAPRIADGAVLSALPYAFPVTAASGLAALIFASRRYVVTGLLTAMYAAMLLGGGVALFLFYFISAMCNTWLVMRAQNRQDVVRGMLPLAAAMLPLGFGAAMIEGYPLNDWGPLVGCLLLNVVLTQFLMFAVSPLLELIFGYTTRFRLMELTNLEQPLLQDLMVSAPGTYHHSLVVSNMVEAGAKAVGANSLLCKVGALYHDIGKLAYPDYFIENQFGGPNRHDKLAPAMSALILVSHVKKGVELATRHRLGDDIVDMIRQHHGSSIMRFFYQKAMEQNPGETLRAEDFQYPGPRPQTREAAIVMVADMVEASSRTLSDPTPARIKTHIDTIMRNIFADGQLDEATLTFQDMHRLAESFARILTGLFHQRIVYPDFNRSRHREETPPKAAAAHGAEDEAKPPVSPVVEQLAPQGLG